MPYARRPTSAHVTLMAAARSVMLSGRALGGVASPNLPRSCFCTTPGDRRTIEGRTGPVVLGLLLQDAMLQPRASRKSKHLPPAEVVLGRDTCDTGGATLPGERGGAPSSTCLEEEGYRKTSAHSRPHVPENRQIYQTKEIESSGLGLESLDDAVAKFERALLLAANCPALCTMQRPSKRVTMCRWERGGGLLVECPTKFASTAGFSAGQDDCVLNVNSRTHTHLCGAVRRVARELCSLLSRRGRR